MKRRLRPVSVLVALLTVAVLAAAWFYLAPSTIGGRSVYSFTYGISMEPELHRGDLAVVRAAETYAVGDVALYRNGQLHRRVLHRIVGVKGGRFVMKGDNNAFIDTFQPRRADVVGKLWFVAGGVGNWTSWLAKPLHAGVTAGLVALLSLLGSALSAKRKRRRNPNAVGEPPDRRGGGGSALAARDLVPGQLTQVAVGVLGAVALACLLLAAISYSRSTTRVGVGPALYSQKGTFSYEARVPPGPVYPGGTLTTGQPAYLQVVRSLLVGFDYSVRTEAQHTVFGTIGLTAEMANGSGWTRSFPLAAKTPFSRDHVRITGVLPLARMRTIANQLETITGQVPDTYTVTIHPSVTLAGQVAGTPLREAFAPPLQLALDRYKLTLPPAGASADTALERSQDGPASKRIVPRTISFLGAKMDVRSARRLSLVLGSTAFAGALGLGLLFFIGLARADEPTRIQARFGHLIAEISSPRRRFAEHDVVMARFEDLVRVAERLGRMILHAVDGTRHIYLIEDNGVAYRYEARSRAPDAHDPPAVGSAGGATPASRSSVDG